MSRRRWKWASRKRRQDARSSMASAANKKSRSMREKEIPVFFQVPFDFVPRLTKANSRVHAQHNKETEYSPRPLVEMFCKSIMTRRHYFLLLDQFKNLFFFGTKV
jgi:hypothetical protein